ncbi:unnamed protein product [Calypogeia fissa]
MMGGPCCSACSEEEEEDEELAVSVFNAATKGLHCLPIPLLLHTTAPPPPPPLLPSTPLRWIGDSNETTVDAGRWRTAGKLQANILAPSSLLCPVGSFSLWAILETSFVSKCVVLELSAVVDKPLETSGVLGNLGQDVVELVVSVVAQETSRICGKSWDKNFLGCVLQLNAAAEYYGGPSSEDSMGNVG